MNAHLFNFSLLQASFPLAPLARFHLSYSFTIRIFQVPELKPALPSQLPPSLTSFTVQAMLTIMTLQQIYHTEHEHSYLSLKMTSDFNVSQCCCGPPCAIVVIFCPVGLSLHPFLSPPLMNTSSFSPPPPPTPKILLFFLLLLIFLLA